MQMKEEWTGTATDLFNEICVTVSPRALSHRLRVLAPSLAVAVEFHRIHKGVRQITLTNPSPCYAECLTPEFVGQTPRSARDPLVALPGPATHQPEAEAGQTPRSARDRLVALSGPPTLPRGQFSDPDRA